MTSRDGCLQHVLARLLSERGSALERCELWGVHDELGPILYDKRLSEDDLRRRVHEQLHGRAEQTEAEVLFRFCCHRGYRRGLLTASRARKALESLNRK